MRFKLDRNYYIPKNSCTVTSKLGAGTVYTYTTESGKPAAVAFIGKQSKPTWRYSFSSPERRAERIAQFFGALEQHHANKLQRRADASHPHTLKPCAIIVNSWGYDQTNVDWYIVIAASRNFVTLRKIAGHCVEQTGSMSAMSAPAVDVSNPDPATWAVVYCGEPERHKVSSSNSVSMPHGIGSEWDGHPKYKSWYA